MDEDGQSWRLLLESAAHRGTFQMARQTQEQGFSAPERRTTAALAAVFAMRMLGLFVVLPVLAVYGGRLEDATPLLVGLAIGVYGLLQGLLQIPYGMASDRYGRKRLIYLGLALFALGGLVAAASSSIWGVIVGRAIQGAGAVAGVVMALLADLVREERRTRAMAVIGATVGLSFGLAMVLGPLIASAAGLSGLFLFTSLMALLSLALVAFRVPAPQRSTPVRPTVRRRLWPRVRRILRHPDLLRLNAGVFLLHLSMTAMFIVVPPALVEQAQLPVAAHWKIYLPVILLSLALMVPLLMRAERQGRPRSMLLVGATGMVASLALLAILHGTLWGVVAGLLLYFTAFNLLEAMMPSLVSRLSPAHSRGAALGVYASSQFFGAFAGGLLGGGLATLAGGVWVLPVAALLVGTWALALPSLRLRSRLVERVVAAPEAAD
jgi:MFS family permease